MTLTEFLLARIAEDQENAMRSAQLEPGGIDGVIMVHFGSPDSPPIAVMRPKRIVAECESRRRIIAAYQSNDNRHLYGGCRDDCEWKALEYAMQCLALPYAEHPDYREEWKP